jgi:hypothetical protein
MEVSGAASRISKVEIQQTQDFSVAQPGSDRKAQKAERTCL